MKVWVVSKGQYSDWNLVAIKSNEEAARRLMKKCSTCCGTGKAYGGPCWDCEDGGARDGWNEPLEIEVEDE